MTISSKYGCEDVESFNRVIQGRTINWPRNRNCSVFCLVKCSYIFNKVIGMLVKILGISVIGLNKCLELVPKIDCFRIKLDLVRGLGCHRGRECKRMS